MRKVSAGKERYINFNCALHSIPGGLLLNPLLFALDRKNMRIVELLYDHGGADSVLQTALKPANREIPRLSYLARASGVDPSDKAAMMEFLPKVADEIDGMREARKNDF